MFSYFLLVEALYLVPRLALQTKPTILSLFGLMEADPSRRGLKWEGFQVKENIEGFSPGFIFVAIFRVVSKQCALAG